MGMKGAELLSDSQWMSECGRCNLLEKRWQLIANSNDFCIFTVREGKSSFHKTQDKGVILHVFSVVTDHRQKRRYRKDYL